MADLIPTFRDLPTFRLAGIRRWHALDDAQKTIPVQWQDLRTSDLPGFAHAQVTYGVTAQMDLPNQRIEYFSGYEVLDFEDIPTEGRMIVPASLYAVFLLNTVSDIRPFWQRFFPEWLAASEYEVSGTPDFERYDARFNAVSRGPLEVFVPVS